MEFFIPFQPILESMNDALRMFGDIDYYIFNKFYYIPCDTIFFNFLVQITSQWDIYSKLKQQHIEIVVNY